MGKLRLNLKSIEDERIKFVTNTYAAKAFYFLSFYLVLSIVIKSFTLDVGIFLYWDNAIAMVVGALYMIYRSANEGVAFDPVSSNVFNPHYIKMIAFTSLLMGLFIAFVISGMDERLAAFMPGILEKLAGTFIVGLIFSMILITTIWIIDVLPTKMAFKKSSKLIGEPGGELPDNEELIKQSHVKDERIDSITKKYAANAFYFLFVYIIISTSVKFFIPDLSLIVYVDAFLAALIAGGYFTYEKLLAGVYSEHKINEKENIPVWITFAFSCLVFGLINSFIVFPRVEGLAAILTGFSSKLLLGLMMAVFFGFGMILIGKIFDWFGKKSADELIDSE